METCLLGRGTLTRLIVLTSVEYPHKKYAHTDNAGLVVVGENDVFSTHVKIEVERAKSNERYVNLRFCHTNKYWALKANDDNRFIAAESKKTEEDTTNPLCTLFEPRTAYEDLQIFYLIHVQSGEKVRVDSSLRFYLKYVGSNLRFVNWDTLVKLPKHVAFKGHNGRYLAQIMAENKPYLELSFEDPMAKASGHEVHLVKDGYIGIKSDNSGMFWRRSTGDWILADSNLATLWDRKTVFWPVKVGPNTIALRNADIFCKAYTDGGRTQCLNAAASTITTEARLVVEELVLGRRIYNVRYWMENARIFNETPYVAGTTTVENNSDNEASLAVSITYEDSSSRSFSCSGSLTVGVTTSFEGGVPFITKVGLEVNEAVTFTLEWDDTTTITKSVTSTGSVTVPPRTKGVVSYVGTKATCDVPFSYTQQDKSSTDGKIVEIDQIDGVFRGVNAYNFSFNVEENIPL